MAKRICDHCGKEKDTTGGKTCETGHFVCKDCYYSTQGIFSGPMKWCPLCEKPLH
jgi:NMD protein affecting ribosome stability and mRNA decay